MPWESELSGENAQWKSRAVVTLGDTAHLADLT
jgi:hypothetical protein